MASFVSNVSNTIEWMCNYLSLGFYWEIHFVDMTARRKERKSKTFMSHASKTKTNFWQHSPRWQYSIARFVCANLNSFLSETVLIFHCCQLTATIKREYDTHAQYIWCYYVVTLVVTSLQTIYFNIHTKPIQLKYRMHCSQIQWSFRCDNKKRWNYHLMVSHRNIANRLR